MLSKAWAARSGQYDFIIIGSGYGGAITAARLATGGLNPQPSICILERGKEWQPGDYPETPLDVVGETRSEVNPLGLYELLTYRDISVIKGSGLGRDLADQCQRGDPAGSRGFRVAGLAAQCQLRCDAAIL